MHKNLSGVTFPLLSSLTVSGILIFSHNQVLAQVIPDNTLGAESSVVNPRDETSDSIDGGAIRGQNLFHSFQEFNVDAGRGVYFNNPEAVTNIFSRVTGNDVSNILGTLGVDGAANLFLINPNGIVFGEGASLDVQGSFAATTADGIEFGDRGFFSASNPESPKLLTINPSAYLFNQVAPGAIVNNSRVPAGKDLSGIDVFGLRVPNGKSLSLIGGDVSMDGGWAIASGGRIELGGLTEAGSIGIQSNGNNNFSLNFPEGLQRGDIFLTNKAIVGVVGDGGGSIAANARNLEISANSEFFAGIGEGLTANAQAGDIAIDATGKIELSGTDSLISNSVQSQAVGNAGNINIKTSSLSVTEGGEITSSTFGKGDSGNVSLTVDNAISLDASSYIVNNVQDINAVGNAGKIDITTGSLSATNGSQINSYTRGRGDAGDITIQATDKVTFDGFDSNGNYSSSASSVEAGGVGDGGNIDITSSSLALTNGGKLDVSIREAFDTFPGGRGKGGTVNINLRDALKIFDTDSGIFAGTGIDAVGRGGDITIQAGNIAIENSGTIISETYGKGDAGDISINTRNLIVKDSQLGSVVHGEGNAGTFKIIASDFIELSGEIPGDEQGFPGGILAQLDVTGKGKGGNLDIETRRLSVSDGSKVQAATFGEGNAGSLFIRADDIDVFETEKPNFYSTGIFAGVQFDPRAVELPKGNGGNLTIETRNLSLRNGAEISSSTIGQGDSGNISITADNSISLDASSDILNNVQSSDAVGNAGKIDITTGSLSATNGSQINSFTSGQGNAGDITIQATDAVTFDGFDSNGFASSSASSVEAGGVGDGGNINITANSLALTNGGELNASVREAIDSLPGGEGQGGNININVDDTFKIADGNIPGIFASLGTGAVGNGGNIEIQAGNLVVQDGGEITSSTLGQGDSGNIAITADNSISLDASSYIANNVEDINAVGNAGKIDITTGLLSATNGSQINSFTRGRGDAGDITIQATDAVTFDSFDSNGFASSLASSVQAGGVGDGGNLNIEASSLALTNGGYLETSVREASDSLPGGRGQGGTINVNLDDELTISGENTLGIFATLGAGAVGSGGNIKIQAENLFVKDGGRIISSTFGEGNAGKIFIEAQDIVSLVGFGDVNIGRNVPNKGGSAIESSVNFRGEGEGGDITINAGTLRLDSSQINTSTAGKGDSGDIIINARDSVELLQGSDMFAEVTCACEEQGGGIGGIGDGGDIQITTGSLLLDIGANLRADTEARGNGGNIILMLAIV